MGRFGRHLPIVTGLYQAGWLTLYGEIQVTFEEITGFDARMRVPRDGHTRLYFCLRQYCHVARHRTVRLRQDLSRYAGRCRWWRALG